MRALVVWVIATGSCSLYAQRLAPGFTDVYAFLDVCPQNDPYYEVIRQDFEILRDGTALGAIPCVEPYSQYPVDKVTEELSVLQTLRLAYHMDLGRSNYLPWTPLRLYDWFKSKIGGFNIDTRLDPARITASCCVLRENRKLYVTLTRFANEFGPPSVRGPAGLAAQLSLFAHEVRHVDGFPHSSCCAAGSCDETYDEANLSAYGVAHYLAKQFVTGRINLGFSCDPRAQLNVGRSFVSLANAVVPLFCTAKPPLLGIVDTTTGGACIPACSYSLVDSSSSSVPNIGGPFSKMIRTSAPTCGWATASPTPWITITSGANSMGSGEMSYLAGVNVGSDFRAGSVIAAGMKLPVTQSSTACAVTCSAAVPQAGVAGDPLTFTGSVASSACTQTGLDWDFGDGSVHAATLAPAHTFARTGTYSWTFAANGDGGARCVQSGSVTVAPAVSISSVASAAPGQAVISSGSWVTIMGRNLAGVTRQWTAADFSGTRLPTSLDGVTVKIDGKDAAVWYISPTQLNVQAPANLRSGTVQVEVSNARGSAAATVTSQAYAPGLFPFGEQYVAAVHADGAYVAKSGFFPTPVFSRPASSGDVILLFASGLGPTNPPTPAGEVVSSARALADPTQLVVRMGGIPAAVQFAGTVGVGLYQLNVLVPALADGDHSVTVEIARVVSPTERLISIQNRPRP